MLKIKDRTESTGDSLGYSNNIFKNQNPISNIRYQWGNKEGNKHYLLEVISCRDKLPDLDKPFNSVEEITYLAKGLYFQREEHFILSIK